MQRLLFLSHRIPFPPDKGEKIRAWHIFEHLARTHAIHLGCFIDDPADWQHVAALRARCAALACFGIDRRRQAIRAALRLRPGRSLSEAYFHDPRLRRWVARTLREAAIDRAFVFCSAMAPYLLDRHGLPLVLDMVDVDSEKFAAYASESSGPKRLLWTREARTLLALERRAALGFDRTLLVSEAERQRFVALAPEAAGRTEALGNGVDLAHFSPAHGFANPFAPGTRNLVFTGAMDYRPNIEAVTWFAAAVLPKLRARGQPVLFHIVGSNPTQAVRALAAQPGVRATGVQVTGRVPDTRPYLAHADAVVAPLRIARGVQNKVLEAMAMARPVVATAAAQEGIRARPGRDLLVADDPAAIAALLDAVLDGAHPGVGRAARLAVEAGHDWAVTLRRLDTVWTSPAAERAAPPPGLAA